MIFVTVGVHDQPFDRLVAAAGELAAQISEPVIIQRGASSIVPCCCESFDYTDEAGMDDHLSRARVVIAHGGAGTILQVLEAGRPLVLVPRLQRFAEHFDDHQEELTEALAHQGRVVAVWDLTTDALLVAIEAATAHPPLGQCARELQQALEHWLAHQTPRDSSPRRVWLRRPREDR